MDSNIQTLVFKAKQGDNSAFSTLYQIYYPKMKGICINILKEDKDRVKILGRGELNATINVTAHSFSKTAKTAIEAKGGAATTI